MARAVGHRARRDRRAVRRDELPPKGLGAALARGAAAWCSGRSIAASRTRFAWSVAGNPDYRRWQALAQRLGIAERVSFVGLCSEMRDAYFAADFLVHPTFYDPCSLVVLEALACALPVITTRANGASELLHPLQEGYVVDDPHDHQRLAWCHVATAGPGAAQRLQPGRAQDGWALDLRAALSAAFGGVGGSSGEEAGGVRAFQGVGPTVTNPPWITCISSWWPQRKRIPIMGLVSTSSTRTIRC